MVKTLIFNFLKTKMIFKKSHVALFIAPKQQIMIKGEY